MNDEIVPYNQDQVFIKQLCTQGTPMQHTPLTGDHISGEAAGAPAVLSFLQARLKGAPFVNDCATILAAPTVPQVPPITMPATPASLPEAPAAALLLLAGLAAGTAALRRRGR